MIYLNTCTFETSFFCPVHDKISDFNNNNNNNNNNLFLISYKLTSEYDQMRLATITTCNNYNKVYLRIPKIYNLKFSNLTITGKSLPK